MNIENNKLKEENEKIIKRENVIKKEYDGLLKDIAKRGKEV